MARDAELDLLDAVARGVASGSSAISKPAARHRELLHRLGDAASSSCAAKLALLRRARRERAIARLGLRGALARAPSASADSASAASRASVSASSSGSASGRTRCLRATSWIAASRSSTRASSPGSRSSFCAIARAARARLRRAGCARARAARRSPASAGSCAAPASSFAISARQPRASASSPSVKRVFAGVGGLDQRRRVREPRLRLRERRPFVGGRRRAPRARAAAPRAPRAPRPTRRAAAAAASRFSTAARHARHARAVSRASAVKPPNASTSARCTSARGERLVRVLAVQVDEHARRGPSAARAWPAGR